MTSFLSTLPRIAERSEATPALWNRVYDMIESNFSAVDITQSGVTLTVGSTLNIAVPSSSADYIRFTDTDALRSTYIIGSHVGGTADGLNIYDASGSTMIASFSKQSIRFYQNVVGPVFDTGGALSDTYNAATFIGSGSTLSGIQAAINQASIDQVHRVYLPASMYPYDASKISFINAVQMVREGGNWSDYDLLAYGGHGDDSTSNTSAFQALVNVITATGGVGYIPPGIYRSGTINDSSSNRIWLQGTSAATIRSLDTIWLRCRAASAKIGVTLRDLAFGPPASGNTVGSPMILLHGDSSVGGVIDIDINNLVFQFQNALCDGLHLRGAFDGRVANVFGYPSCKSSRLVVYTGEDFNSGNIQFDTIIGQAAVTLQIGRAFNNVGGATALINTVLVNNLKCSRSVGEESMHYVTTTSKSAVSTSTLSLSAADVSSVATGDWVVCADPYLPGDVLRIQSKLSSTMLQLSGNLPSDVTSGTTLAVGTFGAVLLADTRGIQFNSPHFEWTGFGAVCSNVKQVQFINPMLGSNVRRGIVVMNGAQNIKVWYPIFSLSETTKVLMEVFAPGLANVNNINNALIAPAGFSSGAGPASFLSDANTDDANNVYWPNPDTTVRGLSGSAVAPSMSFKSEISLGWYSSAASTVALSYGTLKLPGVVTGASTWSSDAGIADRVFTAPAHFVRMQPSSVNAGNIIQSYFYNGSASGGAWNISFAATNASAAFKEYARIGATVQTNTAGAEGGGFILATAQAGTLTEVFRANQTGQIAAAAGTAVAPIYAFQSELSLGFYRSGTSTMKLSYGTLDLTNGGAVTSIASLTIKSGSNNACGSAVLGSNGSVNVANTYVKTGDLIFLTDISPGGTIGTLEMTGIRNSSGFTIASTNVADTSTVAWLIVRPG